jgi:hypothetical protein
LPSISTIVLGTPDNVTDTRSLHLARIELGLRWRLYQSSNVSSNIPALALTYLSESYIDQITSYIDIYASKTTGLVMYDIYRALEYLSSNDRLRIHAFLIEQMDKHIADDNIQQLINILSCTRLFGDIHRSWLIDHHAVYVERLLERAQSSTTPLHLSIELLLLVATMMEEIERSPIELYNLLDSVYERDTSHFDSKLYLYKLGLYFNCTKIMKDYFERLEIKNIQYYSLGYLLTDHNLRIHSNYRHLTQFFQYLTNILLVYTDDSWNQIMFCYKYGNFLRINEIRTFSDCYLSLSLIYMQSLIGSLVIDLIQNGNRYQSIGNILGSSLHQALFENKSKDNQSLHSGFFKTNNHNVSKLQDTRDFDIWPKIDHRQVTSVNAS